MCGFYAADETIEVAVGRGQSKDNFIIWTVLELIQKVLHIARCLKDQRGINNLE